MSLTIEQALTLDVVHQSNECDKRGRCRVWRRNGATQTWKRDPARYRLPLKFGLYHYDNVTDQSDFNVHAPEDCPHITQDERDSHKAERFRSIIRDSAQAHFQTLISNGFIAYDHATGVWRHTDTNTVAFGRSPEHGGILLYSHYLY